MRTSINRELGDRQMWLPHFVQYRRSLMSLLLNFPRNSAPLVRFTFSAISTT